MVACSSSLAIARGRRQRRCSLGMVWSNGIFPVGRDPAADHHPAARSRIVPISSARMRRGSANSCSRPEHESAPPPRMPGPPRARARERARASLDPDPLWQPDGRDDGRTVSERASHVDREGYAVGQRVASPLARELAEPKAGTKSGSRTGCPQPRRRRGSGVEHQVGQTSAWRSNMDGRSGRAAHAAHAGSPQVLSAQVSQRRHHQASRGL
jgi:hypothetical protein